MQHAGLRGIPNVTYEKYNFTVTYRDGIESYPIVESVKSEAKIEQQVMDDFNGLGYFGSMKFNE